MLTKRDRLRKRWKKAANLFAFRQTSSMPIFIFGEMRSGTNMLTECMDRSMATEVFNETDEEAFDDYVLREDKTISKLIEKSTFSHVVFKSLADSARAPEILDRFPLGKGIWIYRSVADVVNSAMLKWTEHNKYLYYILYEPEVAAWRAWNLSPEQHALIQQHYSRGISEVSARALIWYVRNSHYLDKQLEKLNRVRLVKYEDLAKDPIKQLAQIFEFVELQFSPSYVDRVMTSSIGKSPPPEIDEEIELLCRQLTTKLDNCLGRQCQT